jgi:hypothetical protein
MCLISARLGVKNRLMPRELAASVLPALVLGDVAVGCGFEPQSALELLLHSANSNLHSSDPNTTDTLWITLIPNFSAQ